MNQTTEKSVLDISVYTNYIVNNCIREHIELKNEVKTKGVIFDKNRYAILTSHRFLVFANREAYLNKKKPRKEFNLTEHDFVVDSDTIQILKEGNVLKEYIFPTIEIAVHWWESILQLKRAPRVEEEGTSFNGFNQDISRIGKSNQQQDSRGNISTVFTKSVMYDIDGPSDNNNNNKGGGFGELVKEETERRKQLRQPIKKTVVSKVPEDKKSETSAKFPTEGNENNKQVPKDNTKNNDDDDDDNEEEEGELNKSRIGKGKNNDDDNNNNENDLNNKEPYKDIIGKDHNSNNDNNNKPNNININFNNDKQSNKSKEPIKHVTNNYIILKSAYSPTKKEKGNDKNSNNNDNNSKRSNNEDNPETQNDNNNNNNNSKSNNDSIPNNEPFVISSVISNNEPNKQMTKPKDNSSPFINNTQPLIQPKSLHYVNTLHPHYEPQRSQNNSIHFHNDNTEPKTNHPQNDFNDKPTNNNNNNNNAQDNNQPFMNNIDDNFFPLKSIHSTQSKFSTNSLNKTSSIFKKVITPSNSSSIPTQNVISNNNNNNHNNSSIRFSALLETEGNLNTLSIIPKQKDLSPNGSLSNEIVPTQENLTIKEVPAFKTKIDLLEKEEPSIRLISNNNNNNNTNDNKPDHKKLILEQYFNTPHNNIFPSTITPIKVIKKGKNKLYPITHCFYIEHDDDDDNDDDDINNTKPKEETKQNANKNSRKKKKRKNRKNKSISYSNNNNNNDDYHLNNNSNVFYKDINIENDITPTKRTQEQPKTLRTKPMNETPLTLKRNSSTIGTQTDIKYNNDDIQNSINNESNDYDKIDNDNNNNNNTHYKSRNTNKGNNIEPISIDNIYHNEPNNFKGMNNTVDNIIYNNNNNENKERSSNCNNNSLLDYNNKKYSRNTYEPIYNNPNNKTLFNIEPKNPFNNAFECNETKDNNNNNTFISRYKLYGRNTHNNSNNQQHNIPNNITTDSITTPYSYRTPNNTNTTHYKQNIPLRTTNPPTFHNRSSSVTSNTSYYPPYSLNNNNPSMYHNYNHNHHINKSYYFIEKSFIKQTSQSPDTSLLETSIILPNNNNNNNPSTTTKIKPSTLIENLLQNRYSKPMLKLSLKDNSLHSSLISKVYDSISYVMSIQNSNYLVLNALYIKLPKLIRKRLNQEDLMLLSKNKGTIGFGPKTLVNEVALLIGRDIDELVNMFRKFHKIVFNSHNNTKYSTNNNNNKVSEMEMKKENFENEMSKLKNEIILINS